MKNCKVLVVEDEVAIRDMLRMALEIADLRCIEFDGRWSELGKRAQRLSPARYITVSTGRHAPLELLGQQQAPWFKRCIAPAFVEGVKIGL